MDDLSQDIGKMLRHFPSPKAFLAELEKLKPFLGEKELNSLSATTLFVLDFSVVYLMVSSLPEKLVDTKHILPWTEYLKFILICVPLAYFNLPGRQWERVKVSLGGIATRLKSMAVD